MARTSSTKKAAKLAQRGGGAAVRFQGGTLFPMIVCAVLVLGMLLIVYSRQSKPDAGASPPSSDNHWHASYGFYLCNPDTGTMGWYQVAGALEAQSESTGAFINQDYSRTGVHSHEDGIIHWHPFTSAATGNNARLGVFLDNYGIDVTGDSITFGEGQPTPAGNEYQPNADDLPALTDLAGDDEEIVFDEEDTDCGDDDGTIKVQVWNNFSDAEGSGDTYTTDFHRIRFDQDAMVFTIAFVPDDEEIPMPPWSSQLPQLAGVDGGTDLPEGVLDDGSSGQIPEADIEQQLQDQGIDLSELEGDGGSGDGSGDGSGTDEGEGSDGDGGQDGGDDQSSGGEGSESGDDGSTDAEQSSQD